MKPRIHDFIKGIFLTSIATLSGTDGHATESIIISDTNADTQISQDKSKPELSKKLLLKINNDNSYLLAGHRSHRSHSSHRSHYSSQTGSSTGSSSRSSSGSSGYSGSSSSGNSSSTLRKDTSSQIAKKVYILGDRILKKGMKGHDVTELRNILVKKNYIKLKEGEEKVLVGETLFDEDIEKAVKQFQKDHQLSADGVVGTSTVYYLKKEDANKETK